MLKCPTCRGRASGIARVTGLERRTRFRVPRDRKECAPARANRRVSRGQLGQGDGYPSPTVIENAEEYRLTLEALADVEVQLGAVDETLCNLPEALRDVMRRALADNRDALLQEIAAFEELSGVSRGDPPAGSPGPSVNSST